MALTGPYRLSRNPLYVANIGLFTCFALASGRGLAVALPALLVLHYLLIISWEEARLLEVHGDAYRELMVRVPRWLGRARGAAPPSAPLASWGSALRAERGTLVALLLVFGALAARVVVGC